MEKVNNEKIASKEQYEVCKSRLNEFIKEATAKKMLEPEMDNEYTRQIGSLALLIAEYEENSMNLHPLKKRIN